MGERRKGPRYSVKLYVYFPEFNVLGNTSNISLDGCYVTVNSDMSEGFITDLLLELPVVGVIALKGYVQHLSEARAGAGFQFVQVNFEPDQLEYYNLYSQFLKIISQLDEVKENYLDLAKKGKLKFLTLPNGSEHAKVI